jgi:cyclic pyranopterin phosphate synthase
MVDVSAKTPTLRTAIAEGRVRVGPVIAQALRKTGNVKKGNVFETARLAGILAAKRVDQLIPLCHGLPLEHVRIDFTLTGATVRIEAEARTTARTGVEMEALTAVTVAALTIYDMCKALGKGMNLEFFRLLSKTGGKSGDYTAPRSRR